MVVYNNILAGASGVTTGAADYQISRSLRFSSGDSSQLTRTPSSEGNRKTWTWSGWVKRSGIGTNDPIFEVAGSSTKATQFALKFHSNDYISIDYGGAFYLQTTRLVRDPSAWMHLVVAVNTTLSTANNRIRLYINGVEETLFTTRNNPNQNEDLAVNRTAAHTISASSNGLDGYLADVHFVDGVSGLTASDFGEFDSNNVWQAKKFTHGTAKHLGDWINDTVGTAYSAPTGSSKAFDGDDSTAAAPATSSAFVFTPSTPITGISKVRIRAYRDPQQNDDDGLQLNGTAIGSNWTAGGATSEVEITVNNLTSLRWETNSISHWYKVYKIEIYYDGAYHTLVPGDINSFHLNFEDTTSNQALCYDASISSPALNNKGGFDAITYTGNGGTQTIKGLAFQPDLVWLKARDQSYYHILVDSVRGNTKELYSNDTTAESTTTNTVTSFDSNGFSLGNRANTNENGTDYVAWAWKAGGTASSNTDGSITSQVSASDEYGFSVVKWTGQSSGSATIGHGLSSAPKFILVKALTGSVGWTVGHDSIGWTKRLKLNATDGESTSSNYWNDTAPTSSVFTSGANNVNNTFVAYCWSEVSGFSKFSSYTGNGSTSGPTVTTGFKPRYVLLKHSSGSGNNWMILDSARAGDDKLLFASSSGAENTGTDRVKFTDTGFQILDSSGGFNTNGETYIYAAFGDRAGNNWTPNNLIHGPTTKTFTDEKPDGSAWGNIANAFDGNTSTYADGTSNNGTTSKIVFNPPLTGVTSLRLYWYGTSNYGYNNTNIGTGSTTAEWKSVYSGSATTVNNIIGISQAGNGVVRIYAIEVNGTVLTGYTDLDPADIDSLIDTPMDITADSGNSPGNYATLNPLQNGGLTLSNGNLDVAKSASGWATTTGTIGISSGKYYFEYTASTAYDNHMIGVVTSDVTLSTYLGNYASGWGYQSNGNKVHADSFTGSQPTANSGGDIIQVAVDMDAGKIWFGINGTYIGSGNPSNGANPAYSNLSGTVFPAVSHAGTLNGSFNFGARDFSYTPPTNFVSICTTNLPDPTIADPSTAFEAKTYTGTDNSNAITGLGHSPDLLWIKRRSGNSGGVIFDQIRGVTKALETANSGADKNNDPPITSFDADGFTVGGSYSQVNANNETYIAWSWDAGSSNTSISAGSLNSSLYDQSQTWSSGITSGSSPNSSYGVANVFNGEKTGLNNTCFVNNSSHVQVDFTTLSSASTVTVHYTANGSGVLKVNGTNQTIDGSGSNVYRSVTVNVSGLSSVRWEQADGSNFVGVSGIEVDGKLLVDNGITLANVPSIASTVRANPSTGFSIIEYSATGSTGTISHQLNAVPDFILAKARTSTGSWMTYHSAYPGGTHGFNFQATTSVYTDSGYWNGVSPDSNVITLGSYTSSAYDWIAYCWSAVEGYSSFGKYTGNGSADGPFVYTGHRSRFILIKRSDGNGPWVIVDTERNTYNVMDNHLLANAAAAENGSTIGNICDSVSNGFKLRGSDGWFNGSGATYVYAAFAEHPFKTARAR